MPLWPFNVINRLIDLTGNTINGEAVTHRLPISPSIPMKRFVDTHATILVTFREIDATSRHNVSYNRQLRSVCVYLRTETEIRAWWKFQTILKRIYDYSQPRNMQNKVFCNDILIAIFHSRNLSCLSTILLVWLWSSHPSFTRPFFTCHLILLLSHFSINIKLNLLLFPQTWIMRK